MSASGLAQTAAGCTTLGASGPAASGFRFAGDECRNRVDGGMALFGQPPMETSRLLIRALWYPVDRRSQPCADNGKVHPVRKVQEFSHPRLQVLNGLGLVLVHATG